MTCSTWPVTCNTWQVGGSEPSLRIVLKIFPQRITQFINLLINYQGVFRTFRATSGMSIRPILVGANNVTARSSALFLSSSNFASFYFSTFATLSLLNLILLLLKDKIAMLICENALLSDRLGTICFNSLLYRTGKMSQIVIRVGPIILKWRTFDLFLTFPVNLWAQAASVPNLTRGLFASYLTYIIVIRVLFVV